MKKLFLALLLLSTSCARPTQSSRGANGLGMAIIGSDYKSTVVSLADPVKGTLTQDDCIDSGSVAPTLSFALSGDTVLSSQTQANHELLLIDRTNTALDFIAPKTCQVDRQISVGTGFYSNPRDVVSISATKAYVTRFETNPHPSGAPNANDQGNDLLIINPASGAITGRIDMAPYATPVDGAVIQARPDRAFLAAGRVYVTLSNLSADFKIAGAGRVVMVDPVKDAVTGVIDLPGYKSCSGIDYVDSTATLIVGCSGDYNLATSGQVAQSALVEIDIGASPPAIKNVIAASATGGRPISSAFAVAGTHLVVVATSGDFSGTPADSLWALDLTSGSATKIIDGGGSFVFGGIAWDAQTERVFVADASTPTPVIRIFDVTTPSAVRQVSSFVANPKSGLPPLLIGWY